VAFAPVREVICGGGAAVGELPHDWRRARRLFRLRLLLIAALGVVAVAWLVTSDPIAQPLSYHLFADRRKLLGVLHCCNVVSNVPFLAVGAVGLWFVLRPAAARPGGPFRHAAERWPYVVFFLGVALTAFGSSYYHLDPNNDRLLWDRLPMAVAFMGLFSAVVAERVNLKVGLYLMPLLVAAGLASVLYWHWTEQQELGDLRFYYLVQFYPMLVLPLLLFFFPARYTGTSYLLGALGWYVLAKVFEHLLDAPIYSLGGIVSGHTLKHLAAALAALWILEMLRRRRPIPDEVCR
jgi:hypothetical protein